MQRISFWLNAETWKHSKQKNHFAGNVKLVVDVKLTGLLNSHQLCIPRENGKFRRDLRRRTNAKETYQR